MVAGGDDDDDDDDITMTVTIFVTYHVLCLLRAWNRLAHLTTEATHAVGALLLQFCSWKQCDSTWLALLTAGPWWRVDPDQADWPLKPALDHHTTGRVTEFVHLRTEKGQPTCGEFSLQTQSCF